MPLSKHEFAQLMKSMPGASEEEILAAAKAKQGTLSKVWDKANEPLTTLPSQVGSGIDAAIDRSSNSPEMDEAQMTGLDMVPGGKLIRNALGGSTLKGLIAGTAKAAGDVATSLTSPVNLALSALGMGGEAAGAKGMLGISKAARRAEGALQLPMVAQGGKQAVEGLQDQDYGEAGAGALMAATGAGFAGKAFKHSFPVDKVAKAYGKTQGIPAEQLAPHTPVKVDPGEAIRIADAYDQMGHNPQDPDTAASYAAMRNEVKKQYQFVKDQAGVKMTPSKENYPNSKAMVADVKDNNHLNFFPSDEGFGKGAESPDAHPMLEVDPETGLSYNDMFRAIHDYFGHAKEGHQFGPNGEENAWMAHVKMFSPEARPAMTSETRGQNSWVNSGPHLRNADGSVPKKNEPGYVKPQDRPFADQKAGLLPKELQSRAVAQPQETPSAVGQQAESRRVTDQAPQEPSIAAAARTGVEPRSESVSPIDSETAALASLADRVAQAPHGSPAGAEFTAVGDEPAYQRPTFKDPKQAAFERVGAQGGRNLDRLGKEQAKRGTTPGGGGLSSVAAIAGPAAAQAIPDDPDSELDDYARAGLNAVGATGLGMAASKGFKNLKGGKSTPHVFTEQVARRMDGLAQSGIAGKDWYENTYQHFLKTFGGDQAKTHQFLDFLAGTSPNASVAGNASFAVKAYRQHMGGDEFNGYMETVKDTLKKITGGEDWGGPKVKSFVANLKGDENKVTVDRWIMRAMGHKLSKQSPSGLAEYNAIESAMQARAKALGMTPRQYQAAVWKGIKDEMQGVGNQGGNYETLLKNVTEQPSMFTNDPLLKVDKNTPMLDVKGSKAPLAELQGSGLKRVTEPQEAHEQGGLFSSGANPLKKQLPGGLTKQDIHHIHDVIKEGGGGATYNFATRKSMAGTDTYAVELYPELTEHRKTPFTDIDLAKFIKKHQALLSDPQHNLGLWLDPGTGESVLGISITTPDKAVAQALGERLNQKAIGFLGKSGYQDIPGTGTGTTPAGKLPPAATRLKALLAEQSKASSQ